MTFETTPPETDPVYSPRAIKSEPEIYRPEAIKPKRFRRTKATLNGIRKAIVDLLGKVTLRRSGRCTTP
jgi:hypothetical protein